MRLGLGGVLLFAVGCGAGVSSLDDGAAAEAEAVSSQAGVRAGDARVFGYVFGDGNFTTDSAPAKDATFRSNRVEIVDDIVKTGCSLGYAMELDDAAISCAHFTTVARQGCSADTTCGERKVTLRSFAYPYQGHLEQMTDPALLKQFFSALLTGEGGRNGLIDDQYEDIPKGHYQKYALIAAKLQLVAGRVSALGLHPSLSAKGGKACSLAASSCHEVRIPQAEGCQLRTENGWSPVLWARVPDSVFLGGDPKDHRNYREANACH